ncbi:MAG: glycosyltransferase, partial [Cetobacterium sp.]
YLRRMLIFKELKNLKLTDIDCLYIRYPGANPLFLYFLKKNKNKKIILEIPTYPYDKEANGFMKKIYIFIDFISRQHLKKYVSNIVTYSEDKKIYGIECININNAIDFDELKLKKNKNQKNKIVFTSVSLCASWHGIDRMLNSIENYYKNKGTEDVLFYIVGEGSESSKLKEITKNSKILQGKVKFFGFKGIEELDKIYDETDIGIGCLANHRKGVYTIQALKNKEYAAKGLPIIYSEDDPGLREANFVYKVSFDEELLNIQDIISWYKLLKITPNEIREYVKNFSWENEMRKVVKKVK